VICSRRAVGGTTEIACAGDPVWTFHKLLNLPDASKMYAHDVNGDGIERRHHQLRGVMGLDWCNEQVRTNGEITSQAARHPQPETQSASWTNTA
jgi:hypothetical protein